MRLVYFGSGSFGLPTLERLAAEHRVALVVTQPDRPAGRGRHAAATPAGARAAELGLDVLKAEDVNDPAIADEIRRAAGAFVVIAFGQKMGPALLDGVFAVNLHASLLPRYRGAAPINWAIINGDEETGVSVIAITQRIDAGDVLRAAGTRINPMETAGELERRLSLMGPKVMCETLSLHEAGRLEPVPQDERLATRAPKLTKADGTVRFDQPAAAVQRRAHGLSPWPGCTVTLDGQRLKLTRVAVAGDDAGADPGALLEDGTVACRPGRVRPVTVQPPGRAEMTLEAYLRGHRPGPGARMLPL